MVAALEAERHAVSEGRQQVAGPRAERHHHVARPQRCTVQLDDPVLALAAQPLYLGSPHRATLGGIEARIGLDDGTR